MVLAIPFDTLYEDKHTELNTRLLENTDINEFITLLEENHLSIIHITKEMKKIYENGFIILLQNERFKLIHSHGDYEVWAFSSKEA